MNIAVIGAGHVGGTLAQLWADKGNQVWVGLRDPKSEKYQALAQAGGPNLKLTTVREAVGHAEVVLLATPWNQAQAAVQAAGDLSGKVLMDCINPLVGPGQVGVGFNTSAAEEIAKWAAGAKVVKAFNNTGSGNMANPDYHGVKVDIFICGDDAQAKSTVSGLISQLGMEPVDCGPLSMARDLEPLAALWVYLAYTAGNGLNIMFKLVRR